MLAEWFSRLGTKFKYAVVAVQVDAARSDSERSHDLGRAVAEYEEFSEGDFFEIREEIHALIDTDRFDPNAFQRGSIMVRGHEHDIGAGDIFGIGQRIQEQKDLVCRIAIQRPL
jgi:hypothetical protein